MVPTRRFWMLVALGIPIAGVAAQLGAPLLAIAYNLLLVSAAYVTGRLAPAATSLQIRRRHDTVLSVRVPNLITLELENTGVETLAGVLRDEPPLECTASRQEFPLSLQPGRVVELTYWVTPRRRGSDFFRGTFVRLDCPLGLVTRQVRLRTEQPVRVYPNVLAMREFDLLSQKGRLRQMGIRQARIRGLGMEFESLREYAVGDDYRKIDWKATARRGKLVVRQYETERNQAVLIVLDIGRKMLAEVGGATKLDHALDASLMLAHAAASAGDQVGLLIYSDRVHRYVPPKKGRGQVGVLIEALHDAVAEPVESDPLAAFAYLASRNKRRALVVAFTDVEDSEQATDLALAASPLVRHHLTLLARVSDPAMAEATQRPVQSPDDLYQRAAALVFLNDRSRAGTVLENQRLHTLEAEPQELAAALVSYYFDVKERALL